MSYAVLVNNVDPRLPTTVRTPPTTLKIRVVGMQCPAPGAFVRLSADNRRFELDGAPFFFTGCNSYYLMTRAAESSLRQQVLEVLDDAKAAGVRVIRTWAFNDGQEWNALQTAPG